ncbi:MAG: hypothetical protein ACI82A_000500 [Candidatus Azotimanducaceae bacterium]|jgi:hypothetical protein
MIFVLLAAFVGLFFLKGPNGEPLLTLDDLKPTLPEVESSSVPTQVYKWQDENGVWQFSNQPVDEGQGEVIELDGNINIMPAVDTSILNAGRKASSSPSPAMSIPPGLTTVSGDKIQEMMSTVNNLQETVDNRKAEMDQMTSGKN